MKHTDTARHAQAITTLLHYKERLSHYGLQSKIILSPNNTLTFSVVTGKASHCSGTTTHSSVCGSVHIDRADKEWLEALGEKVSKWIEWKLASAGQAKDC